MFYLRVRAWIDASRSMTTFLKLQVHSITYAMWRYWFLSKETLVYHHFSIIYDILFKVQTFTLVDTYHSFYFDLLLGKSVSSYQFWSLFLWNDPSFIRNFRNVLSHSNVRDMVSIFVTSGLVWSFEIMKNFRNICLKHLHSIASIFVTLFITNFRNIFSHSNAWNVIVNFCYFEINLLY